MGNLYWVTLCIFCLLFSFGMAADDTTSVFTSSEMVTTNQLTSASMTTNALTTNKLTTAVITTNKVTSAPLTTASLTTSQLTSAPLTTSQFTSAPLTTNKFTSAVLTTSRMTTNQFTSAALTTGRMTTAAMTTNAITSASMTTDEITSAQLTSGEFTSASMTTNEITSASMTTAEMTTAEMTTNEVTSSEMTTNEVTSMQITSSPLTTSQIVFTTSQMTTDKTSQATSGSSMMTTSFIPATVNVTKNMTVTLITITLSYNDSSQVNLTELKAAILNTLQQPLSEAYRIVFVFSSARDVKVSFFFAPSLNGRGVSSQDLTDAIKSKLTTDHSALGADFVITSNPTTSNSTQPVTINQPVTTGSTSGSSTTSTTSVDIMQPEEKSETILGLSKPVGAVVIAIIILGAILLIILIVVIIVFVAKKRNSRSKLDHNPNTSVSMIDVSKHDSAPINSMPPIKEKDLEFPVGKISERCEELRHVVTQVGANGFDVEFNHIEKKSAIMSNGEEYKEANRADNLIKNRYRNVLPPSHTRIILKTNETETNDFINANYISGLVPGSEKAYIATQGPLPATVGDFWRMMWDTDAHVIMNLTKEMENGKVKCEKYWPSEDKPLEASKFKITLKESTGDPNVLITRVFEFEHIEKNEKRTVTQLHYVAWPDHGVPESTEAYLELSRKADELNTTSAPIVVHCSAGIGRSGTFCLVHSVLEVVKEVFAKKGDKVKDYKINICDTLLKIRVQRSNMVQTSEQYEFCYHAIRDGVTKIINGDFEKPSIKTNVIVEIESDKSQKDESEEELPPPPYEKDKDKEKKKKKRKDNKDEIVLREVSSDSSPEPEKKRRSKKKKQKKRRNSTSSESSRSSSSSESEESSDSD